jgi:hypothetical protein
MQNSLFTADYYNELVMSHVDGVNLLYVAMTRASKELYMLVPTRLNTKSKTSENINNIVPLLTESVKCVVSDFTPYTGENGVERKVYCYGSKLQRGSSDVVRKSGNNIILQSYTTHTPDIKISTPHRRFLDEGSTLSNDQRRMGQLLHRVFEQATTLEQVGQKVEQMASQSIISDDEAMRIKQAMQQVAANDVVLEWFSGDWDDVKSEADIIDGQSMRRPDRVMIKSKRAVVVDFKFGEVVSNKYVKQVSDYMKLLQRMELYTTIEGYVWYITLGKVVRVEE